MGVRLVGKDLSMGRALRELTEDGLALPEGERLALATELIDSVEGPPDPSWSELWTMELQRRSATADAREAEGLPRGSEWSEVRARLLRELAER